MGKTLNQPSLKITKKQPSHEFNSLIKILKPKVYITDSTNFKNLVQELTGNGSQSPLIASFPPPTVLPIASLEPPHVIELDDHDSPATSLDCSSDPSLDNTIGSFDYTYSSSEEFGLQWPQDGVMDYVNEVELRNLESWLLDSDPSDCSNDGSFVPMNTYEFDYNMPSVM